MAPSRPRLWHRIWKPDKPWYRQRTLGLLLIPFFLLLFLGVVVFVYLFAAVPLPDDVVAAPTTVLDRTGTEIGTLSPQAARTDVKLDELPRHVPRAVLAAEDRDFYGHRGISLTGTLRALFTNVRAGEVEQGGSTITQQYIKNAALTSERTFTRKAKEAVLALKLERQEDKDTILAFYLNTIYWGRGAYGIEAAAQTYFGVPATELSANQAATLAGMIRAPERFDPAEDPASVDIRRTYVLEGMAGEGWLEQQEATRLVEEGLPETQNRQTVDFGPTAYYMDAVRRELADELGAERIFRGLTVHTEMDLGAQEIAQRTIAEKVAELRDELSSSPPTEEFDPAQLSGALVSIEPQGGGVRALVGGPDYARQQFNAALVSPNGKSGRNQPGSAFKPFALAAFVDDGYSPESRFPAPAEISVDFEGQTEPYEVGNFGNRGFGEQTVHDATLSSTNTVYVQIAEAVGPDKVEEMAVRAGIPDEWLDPNPSLVLGTSTVSVLDMAQGYGTFAGGGVRTEPRFVRLVEDADGEVLLENGPEREGAVPANVAYAVSDILQDNIEGGTGTRAQIGRPAAGKTGTTQESQDAWFVGYVPQLTTAVWFGTLDDTTMGDVTGGSIPAETWGAFMSEATKNMEPEGFPEPDYSGLDILNEEPSPAPSRPSPAPTATETSTCPPGDPEAGVPTALPGECPPATPSPSPDESPSGSPSPSESGIFPTAGESGSPSPTSSPDSSPSESASPSPTSTANEGDGTTSGSGSGSGSTDGGGGTDADAESQSKTESSPTPVATGG